MIATPREFLLVRSDAGRIPLANRSVDMVLGSPLYGQQRTYGRKGIARADAGPLPGQMTLFD